MTALRARPLTPSEERHLRNNEGKSISFPGPLSIMGASNHSFVESTYHSDNTHLYRVHLGSGQYMDEIMGCGPAEGGITVPIAWSMTEPFDYLLFVAKELGIPYYKNPTYEGLLYFQSKHEKAFAECVAYVDRILLSYENRRSLWERWFGPVFKLEWNSSESRAIREKLRQILRKEK